MFCFSFISVFVIEKLTYHLFLPREKKRLSSPDQIALPDFNAGAMENWGLITYRETALLYDPVISSTGNKERVATVISHELAHMVGRDTPAKLLSSQQPPKLKENNRVVSYNAGRVRVNNPVARIKMLALYMQM